MDKQPNYIVFQCYGNEYIFHECAFALLSLSRLYGGGCPANTQIWIYTDNPGWFSTFKNISLPLNFCEIATANITKWRGSIDFVHRVKIEILKDFTSDRNGNVLYIDTDVVFTWPVDYLMKEISNGQLYMHVNEGVVSSRSNPIFTKLDTHLRDNTPMKVNEKPLWDLPMWNAGVLGFDTKYRHLLDDVLTFTDTEYPRFPKHIVEQFAFSVFFAHAATIKAAAPYVLHYWNLKEARTVLASFFAHFRNNDWNELSEYSALLQMPVLMQEKVNFLANRDIPDKLLKKQWQPTDYNWREMLTQL
jgi:hypothetical protein